MGEIPFHPPIPTNSEGPMKHFHILTRDEIVAAARKARRNRRDEITILNRDEMMAMGEAGWARTTREGIKDLRGMDTEPTPQGGFR
jgi:hypothetical protein